jgi:Zn-dependent protease with chaperone function
VDVAAGLAILGVLLLVPVPLALARAGWVRAEPRAALVLWQSVGLAAGLAAVGAGLAVSLHPLGAHLPAALARWATLAAAGDPGAGLGVAPLALLAVALILLCWLLGVTALSAARTWRIRRRHRDLIDLVSTPGPTTSRVIDHPAAAAWCLPGAGSRVVVTTGALGLLSDAELDAVLAHEQAHLAERHDLLILPFTAWSAALSWLGGPRRAREAVGRLVEMVADDRACAGRDPNVLAAALARVGSAGVPAGTLGIHPVLDRVQRLLDPPRRSRRIRALAYLAAVALLAVPTAALFVPVG